MVVEERLASVISTRCLIKQDMLRVKNPDARSLVYASVIFASVSLALFLLNQATCHFSDTLSLRFCQAFFSPYSLVPISVMTLGGTIMALAVAERNLYLTMDTTHKMLVIGFFIALAGAGLLSLILLD